MTSQTSQTSQAESKIQRSDRILGSSMAWVAVRCTLQYIVLPFALPLFGVSGSLSLVISLALSLFALGMMAYNVIQLWPTSWRWRYLGLSAVMMLIIGLFVALDIRALVGR